MGHNESMKMGKSPMTYQLQVWDRLKMIENAEYSKTTEAQTEFHTSKTKPIKNNKTRLQILGLKWK